MDKQAVGELCLHASIASRTVRDAQLQAEAIHSFIDKPKKELEDLLIKAKSDIKDIDDKCARLMKEIEDLSARRNELHIRSEIANRMVVDGKEWVMQHIAGKIRLAVRDVMSAAEKLRDEAK